MGGGIPKELAGVPVVTSTQVPGDRVKGSSGATLTVVVCGDFRNLLIGRAGAIELAASQEVGFSSDQLYLRCLLRGDVAIAHPEAFIVTDDLVLPS